MSVKKTKAKKQHQFTWAEYWFLEKLEHKANMVLEIHLVGGKKEPATDLVVANVNLGPAHPIVWDPKKKAVIRFYQPLTFQRLDESYAAEKSKSSTGERFCIYTDSEYLRYFSKVSYGIVDAPIHHYSFTCSDDIIDILSCEPPAIE